MLNWLVVFSKTIFCRGNFFQNTGFVAQCNTDRKYQWPQRLLANICMFRAQSWKIDESERVILRWRWCQWHWYYDDMADFVSLIFLPTFKCSRNSKIFMKDFEIDLVTIRYIVLSIGTLHTYALTLNQAKFIMMTSEIWGFMCTDIINEQEMIINRRSRKQGKF